MYSETYDDYIRSILGYLPNTTSDMDLESCYPEIYKLVYPMICKKCDDIRIPVTNENIENMTDEIYSALEGKNEKNETRQINKELRDLIKILLIRELLRRRNRPGRPPMPRPPMPGPRAPFRPEFGFGGTIYNRNFDILNNDIFEN